MSSSARKTQSMLKVAPTPQRRSSRNHHRSVLEVVTAKSSDAAAASPESNESDGDDDDTPLNKLVARSSSKEKAKLSRSRLTIDSSDDSQMTNEHPHVRKYGDAAAFVTLSATTSMTSPDIGNSIRRIAPSRASAVKASRSFQLDDEDSDDDSSSLEVIVTAKKTSKTPTKRATSNRTKATPQKSTPLNAFKKAAARKKRAVFDSDDEEYQENDDASDDVNDDSDDSAFEKTSDVTFVGDLDDEENSETSIHKHNKSRNGAIKVGIVHEEDIGEREIDDDDDSSVIVIPKPFGSPRLEMIEPRLHRPTRLNDRSDDSSSYSNSTMDEGDHIKNSTQMSSKSSKKMSKCLRCDSTKDAVTADDLPPVHICFFPPDNQNKQCFALETLRKIALAQPNARNLVVNGASGTIERSRTEFLQPPHFRTPMSDDLLDQIASRFGRAATDVHSEYYSRSNENDSLSTNNNTNIQQTPGSAMRLAQSESIIDQLERYMRQRLGSQDIYCCPICYIVAHQRLATSEDAIRTGGSNYDDDGDSDDRDEYITDFSYDPMTVLRDIGTCHDPFRIASTFCYKKLAVLKEHLRRDHNVDTKVVEGNDIYTRFKVRAQDGLLQRYLNKNSGRYAPTRQGEMLQYWIYGNNSDFVLLLSLISHANLCREIVKQADASSDDDPDAVENAEEYLHPSNTFFQSFSNDARSIWKVVTSPFLKVSKEEIRDFIADDDYDDDYDSVEVEEPILSHHALHMQTELEELERERHVDEELAARYEKEVKRLRNKYDDSTDQSEVDNESYGDSDDDDPHVSGSESDNNHDDWQRSILEKRVTKIKSSTPQKRAAGRRVSMSSMKVSAKKRLNDIPTESSDDGESPLVTASSSVVRKRLAIQDSDDDDSLHVF